MAGGGGLGDDLGMLGWAFVVAAGLAGDPGLELAEEERGAFVGSPEDARPEERGGISAKLAPVHYLTSNEWQLEGFRESIEGLGGGYVGVGSDQAYLFIGWQRPEFAWLADYDTAVVATHRVYAALFAAAPSPDAFIALLHPAGVSAAVEAIEEAYEPPQSRRLAAFFRRNRRFLWLRISKLHRELMRSETPSYLTDAEVYDAVRERVVSGRVRPMVANLHDTVALQGIAAAAMELEVPIRVLYLSNAEEYWDAYPPAFVSNALALPIDESSLILRTRVVASVRDYEYLVGGLESFRAALCETAAPTPDNVIAPYVSPPRDGPRRVVLPSRGD